MNCDDDDYGASLLVNISNNNNNNNNNNDNSSYPIISNGNIKETSNKRGRPESPFKDLAERTQFDKLDLLVCDCMTIILILVIMLFLFS